MWKEILDLGAKIWPFVATFASGFTIGYYVGKSRENPYKHQEVYCAVGGFKYWPPKVSLVYKGDKVEIVTCPYFLPDGNMCKHTGKRCIYKPTHDGFLLKLLRTFRLQK
ncbi:MAG: hypothetical protein DSY42_04465 [Aquifex sp.]|nr:MAG: hypothetical protein DSY42_04465 [Aquifex sp.]